MASRAVWAGRYAVFDEIASGGMASVYLGCRVGPGDTPRVVAIKKLFESFAKQPEFVTMFLDEAHIAARMRHPNVVSTYEFLRIPDSLAIVMEFVLGVSLLDLQRISRDRGIVAPLEVTGAILRDALLGLHAAHEATDEHGQPFGLVHRDVSPHNILVAKDGAARVIDFGIAKAAGRLQVTEVGVMKGKFAYMAPEQIRAGTVDRRVDIYSAGIVLWEALTGAPLFRGSADAEMFSRRAAGTVTAPVPSSVNAKLPSGLDQVVARALAVEASERFATAKEMADALSAVCPTAGAPQVSLWLHGLASSRLRELETKRNEVETAYAAGELGEISGQSGPFRSAASLDVVPPSRTPPPAPPLLEAPGGPLPELELDLPKPPSRAAPPIPPPRPRLASSSGPRSAPRSGLVPEAFEDTQSADVRLELAIEAPAAPRSVSSLSSLSSSATHDRRPRASMASSARLEETRRARGSGFGQRFLLLLLFLVAIAGGVYQFGPSYAASTLVAAAKARGVILTVGAVEPRNGGLTVSNVTMSLIGVPETTMKAPSVELDLGWSGDVSRIVVPGFELAVHGGATEVASHFATWRTGPYRPLSVEAKAGHVLWSDLVAPGIELEGIGVGLTAAGKDESSLAVDAPSITMKMPGGNLGPWSAHVDASVGETKLVVAFDRATPAGPPSFTFVDRPKLGAVFTVTIPRTKVVRIGVPPDLLHTASDLEVDLALEAQVMPTGAPINAHATLALFGALADPAAARGAGDLVLAGSIAGDPSKPLAIDPGTLTVGKASSKLTGSVVLAPDGIRIEVQRPALRGAVPAIAFVLDTRDWTTAHVTAPATPTPPSSAAPATSARRK